MKTYLYTYLCSAILALVITPIVIRLAHKLNVMDYPNARKVHKKPIPRIGGLAIFIATTTLVIIMLFLDNAIGQAFRAIHIQIFTLLATGTFIFTIGLIDDLAAIRARYKLLAQIAAAVVLCNAGVEIRTLNFVGLFTINFGYLSFPITVFWIIAITNAVNLIDGLDGLAAGIAAVTCAVIAFFAFQNGQPLMVVIMLAMLGSISGFLFYNFNPAKIFLGDSGSMFLGFVLGSASVICATKTGTVVALALPALALGLPIFDTVFSILRRSLSRLGIMSPDRSHFHHRLLDMGFRHQHAVIVMYLVTVMTAGLGMFMMITSGSAVIAVFLSVIMLIILTFRVVGAVRFREIVGQLKHNKVILTEAKRNQDIFEKTLLNLKEASSFKHLWQLVADAAEKMGFCEVSLTTTARSGRIHKFTWRQSDCRLEQLELVTMKLQMNENRFGMPMNIETKLPANGSLESTGRKMMLFGRLVDEYNLSFLSTKTKQNSFKEPEPGIQKTKTDIPVYTTNS